MCVILLTIDQVSNSQNPEWDFAANLNFSGDPGLQLVVEVDVVM